MDFENYALKTIVRNNPSEKEIDQFKEECKQILEDSLPTIKITSNIPRGIYGELPHAPKQRHQKPPRV